MADMQQEIRWTLEDVEKRLNMSKEHWTARQRKDYEDQRRIILGWLLVQQLKAFNHDYP